MQKRSFVEMKVAGLAVDPSNNAPIVLLKDLSDKVVLPIWVGSLEANSIASVIENISYVRPMTHDLITTLLEKMKARVIKAEIVDIQNNIFYANIVIEYEDHKIDIDARPSDAIAIALRTGARIFVANNVLKEATAQIDESEPSPDIAVGFEQNQDKLQEILENMSPEDFGKFKA